MLNGNFRRWTTKEIMILQENAGKHSDKELGDMLGRTYQSVRFMRCWNDYEGIRQRLHQKEYRW